MINELRHVLTAAGVIENTNKCSGSIVDGGCNNGQEVDSNTKDETIKNGHGSTIFDPTTTNTIKNDTTTKNLMILIRTMEQWLGLDSPSIHTSQSQSLSSSLITYDHETITTVEDCVPLSDEFYLAFAMLIQNCWNNSSFSFLSHDGEIDSSLTDSCVSLESWFDSIRVTRWLSHFMEFNLSDSRNDDESDDDNDVDGDSSDFDNGKCSIRTTPQIHNDSGIISTTNPTSAHRATQTIEKGSLSYILLRRRLARSASTSMSKEDFPLFTKTTHTEVDVPKDEDIDCCDGLESTTTRHGIPMILDDDDIVENYQLVVGDSSNSSNMNNNNYDKVIDSTDDDMSEDDRMAGHSMLEGNKNHNNHELDDNKRCDDRGNFITDCNKNKTNKSNNQYISYPPSKQQLQKQQPREKYSLPTLLLKALFVHMEQLPTIQSHMYAYIQFLQRRQLAPNSTNDRKMIGTTTSATKSLSSSTPTATTPPFIANMNMTVDYATKVTEETKMQNDFTNQVSVQLQKEYQDHLERIETILLEWYKIGTAQQRKYIRILLGTYWNKFVWKQQHQQFNHHQPSSLLLSTKASSSTLPSSSSFLSLSSSSIRRENTSAAGIRTTLVVLHQILLGIVETHRRQETQPELQQKRSLYAVKAAPQEWSPNTRIRNTRKSADTSITTPGRITTQDVHCKIDHEETCDTNTMNRINDQSTRSDDVLDHLLFQQLIPLHKVDGLVLWRDQMALLELYHEPLTKCIGVILQMNQVQHHQTNGISLTTINTPQTIRIARTIHALLQTSIFPVAGNTPKQVLLLHEIDSFLDLLTFPNPQQQEQEQQLLSQNINKNNDIIDSVESALLLMMKSLTVVLGRCMSSEHSQVAERALQFVKNSNFIKLVQLIPFMTYRTLLPSLLRTEPSWNPTVRKMTYNVLKKFHTLDENCNDITPKTTTTSLNMGPFELVCNELFSHIAERNHVPTSSKQAQQYLQQQKEQEEVQSLPSQSLGLGKVSGTSKHVRTLASNKNDGLDNVSRSTNDNESGEVEVEVSSSISQFSLKAGMGSWRPPPMLQQGSNSRHRQKLELKQQQHTTEISSSSQELPVSSPFMLPRSTRPSLSSFPSISNPKGQGGALLAKANVKGRQSNQAPPLTITGVAPWATSSTTSRISVNSSTRNMHTSTQDRNKRQQQPPVTITGVAPWAITTTHQQKQITPLAVTAPIPNATRGEILLPPMGQKRLRPQSSLGTRNSTQLPPIANDCREESEESDVDCNEGSGDEFVISDDDDDEAENVEDKNEQESTHNLDSIGTLNSMQSSTSSSSLGLQYVLEYMSTKLKPPDEDFTEGGLSKWSLAQMAETPTFLPELKFHDLVFGHDLGSGAFGSVRYARLIDKKKSRSYWAEYAVKIVSTDKIKSMGYEASIQREIASLLVLSHHPGIARLVSTFRFREGAYLVLEYASQGDLHTLLKNKGSLDNDSTRFVMGEVIAALSSIHDMGFVYGDLKPENIVITETGHLKLTDFGGCRPVTADAIERVKSVSKGLLKNLRDGDWKTSSFKRVDDDEENDVGENANGGFQEYYEEDHEDIRIEGTTAYLPPEVVLGSIPTCSADSWALGCVMYQCLTGRPPLLEADDEATKNRIVTFDVGTQGKQGGDDGGNSTMGHPLFQGKHTSGINSDARLMISSLLDRDPINRPTMHQIAQHKYFTKSDVDVFALHSQPAYPLNIGTVSPTPDNAHWSRRQFSSIWAPQPSPYNISILSPAPLNKNHLGSYGDGSSPQPIFEGEERFGYFAFHANAATSVSTSTDSDGFTQNISLKKKTLLPPL